MNDQTEYESWPPAGSPRPEVVTIREHATGAWALVLDSQATLVEMTWLMLFYGCMADIDAPGSYVLIPKDADAACPSIADIREKLGLIAKAHAPPPVGLKDLL